MKDTIAEYQIQTDTKSISGEIKVRHDNGTTTLPMMAWQVIRGLHDDHEFLRNSRTLVITASFKESEEGAG